MGGTSVSLSLPSPTPLPFPPIPPPPPPPGPPYLPSPTPLPFPPISRPPHPPAPPYLPSPPSGSTPSSTTKKVRLLLSRGFSTSSSPVRPTQHSFQPSPFLYYPPPPLLSPTPVCPHIGGTPSSTTEKVRPLFHLLFTSAAHPTQDNSGVLRRLKTSLVSRGSSTSSSPVRPTQHRIIVVF
ncbi:unnamed protein product [Closterium sp. Naga37s-1]|nr:unnamed protein product [Closterium sp. Naga37s-1]